MNKADHKFHRDKRQQIDNDARKNENQSYWTGSNPIFIPKRKKKK